MKITAPLLCVVCFVTVATAETIKEIPMGPGQPPFLVRVKDPEPAVAVSKTVPPSAPAATITPAKPVAPAAALKPAIATSEGMVADDEQIKMIAEVTAGKSTQYPESKPVKPQTVRPVKFSDGRTIIGEVLSYQGNMVKMKLPINQTVTFPANLLDDDEVVEMFPRSTMGKLIQLSRLQVKEIDGIQKSQLKSQEDIADTLKRVETTLAEKWVEVARYEGGGTTNTEKFTVNKSWRLRWSAPDDLYLAVNLVTPGKVSLEEVFNSAGPTLTGAANYYQAGTYYLHIYGAKKWQVIVEQKAIP